MRELAQDEGLFVSSQFTYWDTERKIGVPRYGDQITCLKRELNASKESPEPDRM